MRYVGPHGLVKNPIGGQYGQGDVALNVVYLNDFRGKVSIQSTQQAADKNIYACWSLEIGNKAKLGGKRHRLMFKGYEPRETVTDTTPFCTVRWIGQSQASLWRSLEAWTVGCWLISRGIHKSDCRPRFHFPFKDIERICQDLTHAAPILWHIVLHGIEVTYRGRVKDTIGGQRKGVSEWNTDDVVNWKNRW